MITAPMEKLLKKDASFEWTQKCQGSFDTLKAKMASTPILVLPDWNKEFHVHVDASSTALGVFLAHLGEGDLDHPIAYASRKLSFAERNYTRLKEKAWRWCMLCKNSGTICWVDTLRCSMIIKLCNT